MYKKADVIIDQIDTKHGMYGMFSIEAMALGKPVIASISTSAKKNLPNSLPIISATSEDLDNIILDVIEKDLGEIGRESRIYVEETHDVRGVVDKYNRSYSADSVS
jgi:glycosyltransferase involved in cell wall biosynthesis